MLHFFAEFDVWLVLQEQFSGFDAISLVANEQMQQQSETESVQ